MSRTLELKAYIQHFVYRSAESGFGVANLILTGEKEPVSPEIQDMLDGDVFTAAGEMRGCEEGDTVELTGEFTIHPTYGPQVKIKSIKVLLPTDAAAMERYLASGVIKGVGAKLAHRIVKNFGDDTFRIMEEEPEKLAELKGISLRMAREIGTQMYKKRERREITLFLQQLGVGGRLADRIIKKYGDDTLRVIKENPYRLADEIDGVGFRTADEMALKLGVKADAEFRISGGILYSLERAAAEGHSYQRMDSLLERTAELLGIGPVEENRELIQTQLARLNVEGNIIIRNDCVYARSLFREEQAIAVMLNTLSARSAERPVDDFELDGIERELEVELDDKQRDAVRKSISCGVLILTGGPGTGKTTTMAAILRLLRGRRKSFVLAAPTGRAAKRMTEATGYEARTIHRLLEVGIYSEPGETDAELGKRARFNRNEENPLEADTVIIDEMSMVDMHLFYHLLKACPPGTHLILTGDAAQLPSVGPGQVLRDLIDSDRFPVVSLTRIFRQAAESDIVVNAHRINAGESVLMDNKSSDFFFLERARADVIAKHLVLLIRDKLPSYVNASSGEIQVLVPMRRGPLGAETLNRALQQALNPGDPSKEELHQGEQIWRQGDKVMQTRNDYAAEWEVRGRNGIVIERGLGVFNGDLGIIKDIDHYSQEVEICFDENRLVRVPFSGMEDIELAYAMTIHKSQGSEYPAVLIPILGGPRLLMNRNLLYTAVTRAKTCVVILGSRGAVEEMIENGNELSRCTGLRERIDEIPERD